MSTFSDRFGGTSIQPSDVAYREVTSAADLVLQWPAYATKDNLLAKVMNFDPRLEDLTLFLPDAREASPGESIIFYNNSAFAYTVASTNGVSITTVQPGARHLVQLINNTVADGAWLPTLLGVGTGTLDIAGAAGAGLQAIGQRLNVAFPVVTVTSTRAIVEADRDTVIVWTGGTGILSLPLAGSLTNFNVEIRNQGSGVLTLQPSGGQLIDGVSSVVVNVDESLWLHSASALNFWSTIGRGRATQFAYTQLQKTVTGGDVLLTLTEAANVVQTYTGAMVANVDVIFPSIVQVYFVSNQTTGPFNLRFRNAGPGTSVSLGQGQSAILFSDGINVTNAATTTAGVTQVAYGPGTVSAPSVSINGLNNGFFSPGSGAVSFSSGGVEVVKLTDKGVQAVVANNPTFGVKATGGDAFSSVERPPGSTGGLVIRSNTFPRWIIGANSAAEAGANAGSDFTINRYTDAGALIDSPVTINRATGQITFKLTRDLSRVGSIETFVGPAIARPGLLYLDGSLVSRTTYADLYAFAVATGLVTEDQWNFEGYNGRFSVGNGSTTFRLPDCRGPFIRGLGGTDIGREWGKIQEQAVPTHLHAITDPGHIHPVGDPGHAHGVNDGTHTHGINDPGHSHSYQNANAGQGQPPQANASTNTGGTSNTGNSFTGIGVQAAASNISIQIAGTGVSVQNGATNVSVQATGVADGHPRNLAYPVYVRY